jgi:hypothetical protein
VRYGQKSNDRAIALIMAVAIMAVLAVVGFTFVTSMRMEQAATSSIKNLTQARMATSAAFKLFPLALIEDLLATPGAVAGPLSDHFGETLFTQSLSETLIEWGNLAVTTNLAMQPYYTGTVMLRDESSKISLNAHGNIVGWNYSDLLNDGTAGAADPAGQLYHRYNQHFSAFEISIEQFLYQCFLDGKLWGTTWPNGDANILDFTATGDQSKARVRCANIARAICLYRYGGKKDGNGDGAPDYKGNGKPGVAADHTKDSVDYFADDDKDNDRGTNGVDDDGNGFTDALDQFEVNTGLKYDGIDNDGDGTTDEADEGINEPDEFTPHRPRHDDRAFESIDEFTDAISHSYQIDKDDDTVTDIAVPAATNYTGSKSAAEVTAEAELVFEAIGSELTAHSYTLDRWSASIDDIRTDGFDNDADGLVDDDDDAGAATLIEIVTALDTDTSGALSTAEQAGVMTMDIREKIIDGPGKAAYLYLKLKQRVPGFTLKTALDIIDYRDYDPLPTKISYADAVKLGCNVAQELRYAGAKDLYGMEGLHVTEVGRYVTIGSAMTIATGEDPWTGIGTITYMVATDDNDGADEATRLLNRTSVLKLVLDKAVFPPGKYMLKMTVDVPDGLGKLVVKDAGGTISKSVTTDGTLFFGPFDVVQDPGDPTKGKGTITVIGTFADDKAFADIDGQTFNISDVHVILPYVEVMNMSRVAHNMTYMRLVVEDSANAALKQTISTETMTLHTPEADKWANGEVLSGKRIPRHKAVAGGYDDAKTYGPHGVWYGYFVYVYDAESFERLFPWGNQDGTWGNHAAEDFPIYEIASPGALASDPFYNGWDGTQKVRLLDQDLKLIAGGEVDFYTDSGAFPCKYAAGPDSTYGTADDLKYTSFSTDALAAGRTQAGTDGWFAVEYKGRSAFSVETVSDSDSTRIVSPGRWNHNTNVDYTWLFWPENDSWPKDSNDTLREYVDGVSISDAGCFTSPGELTDVSIQRLPWATMSVLHGVGRPHDWEQADWAARWQPDFDELMAYTVAARSYARVNINTASSAVLAGVFIGPHASFATDVVNKRNHFSWRSFQDATEFSSPYFGNGNDDDGQNDGDDDGERTMWYTRYGNLVSMRGHCFKVAASGRIQNAAGDVLARHNGEALFDRGAVLDTDTGEPQVITIYQKSLPPDSD